MSSGHEEKCEAELEHQEEEVEELEEKEEKEEEEELEAKTGFGLAPGRDYSGASRPAEGGGGRDRLLNLDILALRLTLYLL